MWQPFGPAPSRSSTEMKKFFAVTSFLLCLSLLVQPICVSAAVRTAVVEVSGLTFRYPDADSVRIDLASSGPVAAYTITRSLDRTVIDLPGVTSRLYAA